MMDAAAMTAAEAVSAQARAYCEAVHQANPEAFDHMCHPSFMMTAVAGSGHPVFWDKEAYMRRVAGRDPQIGPASFEILQVDAAADTAHVKLWVDVPPQRFEDYLGFFLIEGEWKLITKLFRTIDGPALEG
ncbi:nuclear transport factor 2 family protein [Roseisalinus antarcticus]|uniref:Putative lumazine-binding protein n=1 Tax=Roseisalinus antarcticus TaxID=254357 RepID=A0A1Y5SIC5_9RHOB|nr:nuclear transport factor 2 family protein [Roseisalinus antarcticus]SLN41175.1 Putative lumazine-binding protein [Roseisalinus antarcticus]